MDHRIWTLASFFGLVVDLFIEIAMPREARLFHHIAERHLAPTPAAFRRGERIDQFARLCGVAVQAFTNGFDLLLDRGFVFGADFFDISDTLFELGEVLANGFHQLVQFALRTLAVLLERLVRHRDEVLLGLLHHAARDFPKRFFLLRGLPAQFCELELAFIRHGALSLQLLLSVREICLGFL